MKNTKKQVFLKILLQTFYGAVAIWAVTHVIPYVFIGMRLSLGAIMSIWVSK